MLPLHRRGFTVCFVGELQELANDLFEVGLKLVATQCMHPGVRINLNVASEVDGGLDDQRVGRSASDQLLDLAELAGTGFGFKVADDCQCRAKHQCEVAAMAGGELVAEHLLPFAQAQTCQ